MDWREKYRSILDLSLSSLHSGSLVFPGNALHRLKSIINKQGPVLSLYKFFLWEYPGEGSGKIREKILPAYPCCDEVTKDKTLG